ncbi:MAG: TonB-dependent receptor [Flavobacteriales bacterium]|nr:TonB-dependent receptor [Flavobacteriales bacterium]
MNYRYSTVALLDKAGILDFSGIPIYQDASFKFVFPTKKMGTFSLIGLGGLSKIVQTDEDDSTGFVHGIYDYKAGMGVAGLKHTYIVSPKIYVKSYVAAMNSHSGGEGQFLNSDSVLFLSEREKFQDNKIKAQTIINYKLNKKNMFQVGGTYTFLNYDFFYEDDYDDEDGIMTRHLNSKGNADMMQSFVSWKYRINNDLTIVSGLHHTHFFLNGNYAIEPRLGAKWQLNPRNNISLGYGMHSKMESVSTYLYNELQENGEYYYPNRNLDFSKSMHFVAGYGLQLNENLHFKTEVYYQHLYNIPVENDSTSYYSLINSNQGIPDIPLVNKGTGRNYGAELTLERFFHNNFYYLLTGSIYKSQYTALDGVERDSRYDANYAANLLLGKEFKIGKKKRNKTIGINTKVSFIGGNRYTPIDLEASNAAGHTVRKWDEPYSVKGDNVFFINLGVTYRVDMKRASHSFKIDIQNLTNNKAVVSEYYSSRTQSIVHSTQLPMIPNLVYTIKF